MLYVDPDFLLEDGEVTRDDLYSEQHIQALDSISGYDKSLKNVLLKSERCRDLVLSYGKKYFPISPIVSERLQYFVEHYNYIGFHELRDKLWDLGVLVLVGISKYRDFFVSKGFTYGVLNFEELPVIIIRKTENNKSALLLSKAVIELLDMRATGELGLVRNKVKNYKARKLSELQNNLVYYELFGEEEGASRLVYSYGIGYCRFVLHLYRINRISYLEMKDIFFNGNDARYIDNLIDCRYLLNTVIKYERKKYGYKIERIVL